MENNDLGSVYAAYLAVLNPQSSSTEERDLSELHRFVDEKVVHNGQQLGISGYRHLIERSVEQYPSLRYNATTIVVDSERQSLAAILHMPYIDKTEHGSEKVLVEHVFYQFRNGRIQEVRSMVQPETK